METSQKILIIGGLLMLAFGFVTGNIMAFIRKDKPTVPRYLALAHEGCYVQGAMLMGLAFAIELSNLGSGSENLAAWLLVIAAVLLFAKDMINWATSTDDEFASRGVGLAIGFIMGPLHLVGFAIIAWGCLQAL